MSFCFVCSGWRFSQSLVAVFYSSFSSSQFVSPHNLYSSPAPPPGPSAGGLRPTTAPTFPGLPRRSNNNIIFRCRSRFQIASFQQCGPEAFGNSYSTAMPFGPWFGWLCDIWQDRLPRSFTWDQVLTELMFLPFCFIILFTWDDGSIATVPAIRL